MTAVELRRVQKTERVIVCRRPEIRTRSAHWDGGLVGVELRVHNGETYLTELHRDATAFTARCQELLDMLVEHGWTAVKRESVQ